MPASFSGTYNQTFDTLAASGSSNPWSNDVTLAGWYLFRQPAASPVAISSYNADTGSSSSGAFVSYGASGSSDRALGGLGAGGSYFGSPASGALAGWFGLALSNATGSAINNLYISFNGEQWRNGGGNNATAQTMVLEYGYGTSFDQVATWVAPGGNFNWTSPVATATAAAVDGNTAGRVTDRGGNLDLSATPWAAGSTLWLRWIETNDSGNDHGLAIDDLSISLTQPVVQTEVAIQVIDVVAAEYGDSAGIRISRTGSTEAELVVPISLVAGPGLATAADLSAPLPASLTIPAGAASVDLALNLLDDSLDEGTETLRIEITAPSGTTLAASGASVDLTLVDNDRISLVSAVQGTGATSPLVGQNVTLRAVVVGDFQLSSELGGFFLQEESADWDTSALSSEGLYVAYPLSGSNVNVALGDRVLLTGLVGERFGQTAITSVGALSVEAQGRLADTSRLDISDLLAQRSASLDLEPYEGMWVRFPETLTVNGLYGQFRFGELELSAGGLPQQPTNVMDPGPAAYAAEQATARRELVLDDGSNSSYRPASAATAAAPVRDQLLRRGDTLTAVEGILAYDFSKFRLHPTAPLSFRSENPRPTTPAAPAAGQLRLASFNVLNTFTTLNAGGALTDSGLAARGANSAEELERQLSKLTAALVGLKADVIGLMELENDADDATLAAIVQRLNAAQPTGSGRAYSFVPTGLIGTDAIKVGLIYNNLAVAPNGAAQVLNSQAFVDPLASGAPKNRPALAQAFRELASGELVNVVVNHLKSKGATDATGADLDQLDGQSAFNATRTAAANSLLEWIATNPTGNSDRDWVILGDLNAYAKEDPIQVLETAGYRNVLPAFTAEPPSSYAFYNPVDLSGALDHMLISPSLVPQATTALDWSINAAEGAFRDYNFDTNSNGNAAVRDFFAADPYRTSDHDPLLLDLDLGRAAPAGLAFAHGVASGDPYADSVILWTRITPPASFAGLVDVQWQIATSADFAPGSIKGSGSFSTSAARDWTVKVEAAGLSADTAYFYRFSSGTTMSGVGQTKTLPVSSDPVRLAVFSCANYTAAEQFAAYGRAADTHGINPYDALVHLGDYIYEYGPGGYGAAEDAANQRGFLPNSEIISLDDYRQRYAQYHTDPNLQALRAAAPLIAIWDDHETANDSWAGGAENHQSDTEGSWSERRDAALKAYYEWLPIREPSLREGVDQGDASTPLSQGYRSFNFGDVLALHILETRLTARDEQLSYPDEEAVQIRISEILADQNLVIAYAGKLRVTAPADASGLQAFAAALAPVVTQELVLAAVQQAWGDPNRDLIGDTQMAWLQQQMASSGAAWQVLGQQVLMQSMAVPAELLLNPGDPALLDKYAAPLQKLATGTNFTDLSPTEQALFSEAGKIPYNLDAWDGYGVERETILQTALQLGKRLISLAGDTHNAWAGVLDTMSSGAQPAGTAAGIEFATPGATSPGLEKYLPGADAYIRSKYPSVDGLDGLFMGYVNGLKYADLNRRGYLDLTITQDQAVANFQLLDQSTAQTAEPSWASETIVASSDFSLSVQPEVNPRIEWQPGWQELDLVFGMAVSNDGTQLVLEPLHYASLPRQGVQLSDVSVIGSSDADRIFAGIGSFVDAGPGNDELFNTDSLGGNRLVAGAGTDSLYLQSISDQVIGGQLLDGAIGYGLSPFTAEADDERDVFLVDSESIPPSNGEDLKILDFNPRVDKLLIDGFNIDTRDWSLVRSTLAAQNIAINASPELGIHPVVISLKPGSETTTNLSFFGLDQDGEQLTLVKLSGPDWITVSQLSLTANTPANISEAELAGASLKLGFSDGQALKVFNAELTAKAVSLTNSIHELPKNLDTTKPFKVADLEINNSENGANTITLIGAAASRFEATNDAIFLKAGEDLEQIADSSFDIVVKAENQAQADSIPIYTTYNFTVTSFNAPPSSVSVDNFIKAVQESINTSSRTELGTINIVDAAITNSNRIELSGTDANAFEVDGSKIYLKSGVDLDFETRNNLKATISVTDRYPLKDATTVATDFVLSISDVNEAPSLKPITPGRVEEIVGSNDTNDTFLQGSLAASDPDTNPSFNQLNFFIKGGEAQGSTISQKGRFGTLSLNRTTGAYIYTKDNNAVNALGTGEKVSEQFTLAVSDGIAPEATQTLIIDLIGANDGPRLRADSIALTASPEDEPRKIKASELLSNIVDVDNAISDLRITQLTITSGQGELENIDHQQTWSYTPAENDDSSTVFSYTVSDGAQTTTGSATLELTPLNDRPTGVATLSSNPSERVELSVNTSTIRDADSPDGGLSFSYQWQRAAVGTPADSPLWKSIAGANGASFTPTSSDVGQALRVVVAYTDKGGQRETIITAASQAVVNLPDPAAWDESTYKSITGETTQGSTLRVDTRGINDPDGLGVFTYQWEQKNVASDSSWQSIAGAKGTTFKLTQDQVGKLVRSAVSFTDGSNSPETVTSTPTAVISNINDAPSGFIAISGTPTKGETLSANTETLGDLDGLGALSYQWLADGIKIADATSQSFTLTEAQVGKAISVAVSYTDAGGTQESINAIATKPVSNSNKAPTGIPNITGSARQGQTLTADISRLADEDGLGTFSYQWLADGSPIKGATGISFTATQLEVSKQLSVVVSYTDQKGSSEAVASAPTSPVENINDEPTGQIQLSGLPTERGTLRAVVASIQDLDGVPSLSTGGSNLQFTWSADGAKIDGATSDSYQLTQSDVGKAISVAVSYVDNGDFSNTISSSRTAKIVNINDSPSGAVVIEGNAQQGEVLTAKTDGLSDPDGLGAFSYQWLANGSPISGATQATFTPTQSEVDKKIAVLVSYKDSQGTQESIRSAATSAITNTNDDPSGDLTIVGSAIQGQTLTANTAGLIDADGLGTFSYQWWANGSVISGATRNTLILGQAQVGQAITVVVSYTDGQGTLESKESTATPAVQDVNDSPRGIPVIQGQVAQSLELTADTSSISDPDGLDSFSYQWQADGSDISGANDRSFTPTGSEVGKRIAVVVSYTDGQGNAESLISSPSQPVLAANQLLQGSVRLDSSGAAVAQGNLLLADTWSNPIQFNGQPLSQLSYQWYANGTAISGATTDRFTPTQQQVVSLISVENSDPTSGASRRSDLSTAVANINDAPTGAAIISGLVTSLPQEDTTLSVDPSTIEDTDGRSSTLSYQWTIDNVAVAAANQASFKPTDQHVGRNLAINIDYIDDFDTPERITQQIGRVRAVNDAPTGNISLSGFLLAGQTLSILDTLVDPDGLTARSYTWERSSDGGSSWTPIVTQSDPTASGYGFYQLNKSADSGTQIRVVARYTDQQGFSEIVRSQPTDRVIGQFSEGRQINYANPDNLALLQWQIRSASTSSWVDLPGESTASLRTENSWGGQSIRLTVNGVPLTELAITAIDSGVGTLPPISTNGAPLEIGVATLSAGLPLDDPDGLDLNQANLQVQWQRFSAATNTWLNISGATGQNYTPTNADADQAVRAQISYIDAQNFSNTLYSNSLKPRLVAPPTPEGSFNAIVVDDVLTAAEYETATISGNGISLSGTITNNAAANTQVSLSFGGQIRQAIVSPPNLNGESTWAYTLSSNDQRFLAAGSANTITATLTQTLNSRVGSTLITRSLVIASDVALPGVNPNSASDPTQSDGIKQEVKSAAAEALLNLGALATRIGQPNVAAAPLGSGNAFAQGADAPTSSYGIFELPGDTSAAGIDTYSADNGSYSIPNTSGTNDSISTPDAGSFQSVTDPIALTIKDVEPGATISFNFVLPQASADLLPQDLTQARYFKLDNIQKKFVNYLAPNGTPYYSYALLNDQNNNQLRDLGDSVILTLQLTDGDLRWDRDGVVNGIIVDPGTLGANVNDSPTGTVLISGVATEGQTLSIDTSNLADADGLGSFSYQWLADGSPITGANSNSYTLTRAVIGKAISVILSYTDQEGTKESVTSTSTAPVKLSPLPDNKQQESEKADDGKIIDANRDGVADSLQDDVVARPLLGSGEKASDYIAVVSKAGVSLANVQATTINSSSQSVAVALPSGESINAALPEGITNKFSNAVLSFSAALGSPGSSTTIMLHAREDVLAETNAYVRFNYKTRRFEDFTDSNGRPLYRFVDTDNNGRNDAIELTLTDGDPSWDGDGILNGVVVDPGFLASGETAITGTKKANNLRGNLLANSIEGLSGNDTIDGGLGNDYLNGGSGRDIIFGGEGDDTILGGKDRDQLFGDSGNDTLYGERGKDLLNGGEGDDIIYGGKSKDYFVISAGSDQIMDFRKKQSDRIMISSSQFHSYTLTQDANNALIDLYGASGQILGQTTVHNATVRQVMSRISTDL